MTPLKFNRCAVLGGESLQDFGRAHVEVTACPAIGMQQGYMAAISLLELIQPAVRAQLQPPVQIEKIGLAGQVTLPLLLMDPSFEGPVQRHCLTAAAPGKGVEQAIQTCPVASFSKATGSLETSIFHT